MTHVKRHSRLWLTGVVAATLAAAQFGWGAMTPAGAQEADECAGQGLDPSVVGAQLFTYRGAVNADGIDTVIEHAASIGMPNMERFGGSFGLDFADYVQLYDDNGVHAPGSHGGLNPDSFEAVLDQAEAFGQEYVGSGGWAPPGIGSLENTLATAANMNTVGAMAAERGMKVYGHNHDQEFTTMYDYDLDGDGETEQARAIEILMAETDPELVSFEIDVHWARIGLAGGRNNNGSNPDLAANLADPSNQQTLRDWSAAHADRIHLLHVKDTDEAGGFANVGEGTTDWAAYFETVPNVDFYFIEHDSTQNAYETVEIGFEYLTCQLYGDNDGEQDITVTVPEAVEPGEFLWTIQGDGNVYLGEMADEGTYLRATGPIDPISVTDTRAGGPQWSISGQVSDFQPGDLAGNHLGWNPEVIEEGAGAEAGPAVASGIDGGDGLSVPQTMASADDGHETGTGLVGADLDLRFPVETDPGDYSATLTITALS